MHWHHCTGNTTKPHQFFQSIWIVGIWVCKLCDAAPCYLFSIFSFLRFLIMVCSCSSMICLPCKLTKVKQKYLIGVVSPLWDYQISNRCAGTTSKSSVNTQLIREEEWENYRRAFSTQGSRHWRCIEGVMTEGVDHIGHKTPCPLTDLSLTCVWQADDFDLGSYPK